MARTNTTTLLLQKLACRNFLISTNGSVFKHPDDVAIARIVKNAAPARLHFNYLSDCNRKWGNESTAAAGQLPGRSILPEGAAGIDLDLLAPQVTLHDEHRRRPRAVFAHEAVHRPARLP